MRELFPLVALVALALGALAIAFLPAWWRARAAAPDEAQKLQREREAAERRALAERTHVRAFSGELVPRCSLPTCEERANRGRFRFVRDEGTGDFVRRAFGAAPRFRVVEDRWELCYCESHAHLAREEMRLRLVEHERQRSAQLRDAELDLGHFEREGLRDRLAEMVGAHARRSKPAPPLVSIKTGTEK